MIHQIVIHETHGQFRLYSRSEMFGDLPAGERLGRDFLVGPVTFSNPAAAEKARHRLQTKLNEYEHRKRK